jgi:hypothetical protein
MAMNRRFSGYSPSHDNTNKSGKEKKKANVAPPLGGNISLPREMDEEKRRELRAMQLVSSLNMELPQVDPKLLPDPDLNIQDPRGDQGNALDGRTVFPMMKGPQPKLHTRVLHGDPDLRQASEEATDLIAAVTVNDQALLAFDNSMTTAHNSLRTLRKNAESLVIDMQRQGNPQAAAEAKNIVELLSKVIEPWFLQLEDHLEAIVSQSTEAQQTQGGPNAL